MNNRRPCVFFDRDGIVNVSPGDGYVESPAGFRLQEGFVQALRAVRHGGFAAVVVTNQQGIGKGLITEADLDRIHAKMHAGLGERGLKLDAVYHCPHLAGTCFCRKPLPGLLLRAARELQLDLSRSWMVGDKESDVDAGRAAGCRTVRIGVPDTTRADFRLPEIGLLADFFRERLKGPCPRATEGAEKPVDS
ncbi:D-glycero-alpha-D-manno-heptose-1,7-bisphosphate 7-phosphatase [Kiritimatiella glycovorans]|uniref:D,D-heptose 1,7-bisphosphate phosphatase n=1 Tax=Kiritimatiella glycovorans TaxID=1307763 RepID=A0A0G3EJL6_9BACT|nr:HAD family hydrolase [Kiritimatiella glycovorans]AKJ64319.1 D,D-heptose 1,7-bisphosphate phosphatase [Kiritimatiella glycovorans]